MFIFKNNYLTNFFNLSKNLSGTNSNIIFTFMYYKTLFLYKPSETK